MRFATLCAFGAVLMAGCSENKDSGGPTAVGEEQVNLYTARHYDSDLALYDRFTRETGIKVNRIEGDASQLIERIKTEGDRSPADVFIAADAGALWRAQQAGAFQPVQSATLDARIPQNLRDPDGHWYGVTRRARVVAYDSTKVKPEEIDDYAKLASPRFKGKLCVRSADSIYNLSLVGAIIEALGPQKADAWVRGVVANMARPPEGGDRDQVRAVASGVCEVALTNSYYFITMANGENEADRKITERVKLAFPSLGGQGAHVNISGAGVAAHAPNKTNALRFVEFLSAAETQKQFAAGNNEFPASPNVAASAPINAYAGFKANPMKVAAFAARQPEAQSMMSAAGWR